MSPPGTRRGTLRRSQIAASGKVRTNARIFIVADWPRAIGGGRGGETEHLANADRIRVERELEQSVTKFLLWCVLLFLCWPLALVALVAYPLVWLLLLPFRIVGIAVEGALELVWAVVTLPVRVLRAI